MTISRPNSTFSIVAHRGLSKRYPENSYIGLKAALMSITLKISNLWSYMMIQLIALLMGEEKS